MKKLLLILVLTVICSSVARAGDFDDGVKAYQKRDYVTALTLFFTLAEQGHATAQFNLGVMYENGIGVIKDFKKSVGWYRMAAEQGYAKAQFNLALMYEDGEGVIQDYKEAVKWYRLAAEQGYADAQYNLGFMYANGVGVIQDYVHAYMWFNLAAGNGSKNGSKSREIIAKEMTPSQISKAQDMARECEKKNYKN